MKILVVEDDSFKADSLQSYLLSIISIIDIEICGSLVEAIDIINRQKFDYVLVDMAIPSHPIVSGEGAPVSFLTGGLDVILELKALKRKDKCIVVTQYPEIEICGHFIHITEAKNEINKIFGCEILDCIEYADNSDSWKINLNNLLINI